MSESQKHGFKFEKIVMKKVFLLPENIIKGISYTAKHDIHKKHNFFDNTENISIKSSGSKTICCGDPFRIINYSFKNEKNTMILIKYSQQGNIKQITDIYEINMHILHILLRNIGYDNIESISSFIKTIPKGKIEFDIHKKICSSLSSNIITLNPKIDSKNQRRLQFSFKLDMLIKYFPEYIIYHNVKPIIRKVVIPHSIKSSTRILHK